MLRQAQHEDFCFILTLSLSKGEERPACRSNRSSGPIRVTDAASLGERPDKERFALANEMVRWTISSDERRELGRAAGES